MAENKKFNRFIDLDDDIEDLNRNGEYSQVINEFEPKDPRYDDDTYELSECGNYKINEDVLNEGNEKIKNMTIMQSLGLGGNYSETGTKKGWLLKFLLPKMNIKSGGDWVTLDNGDAYFVDSKGNKYPTTVTWAKQNNIQLNKPAYYLNQRDKQTIASYIGYKLLGLALGIKNQFEKDKRFVGWGTNGLRNDQAIKFQAFIEDKLKSYLQKNEDRLRDEAINAVPNGPSRAAAGKAGTYGNNNASEYKDIGIHTLKRVCTTAYQQGHAYGEVVGQKNGDELIQDGFLKVFVAGYIKKDKLAVLQNSDASKYLTTVVDTDDFCYYTGDKKVPRSKEAKQYPTIKGAEKYIKQSVIDDSYVLAVSYYSFNNIERMQANEKDNFVNLWRSIVTNTITDSTSIIPVPFSVLYGSTYKSGTEEARNEYKDTQEKVYGEVDDDFYDPYNEPNRKTGDTKEYSHFGYVSSGGWQGLYEVIIGAQSQSGYGFRNATSGRSPRDARNLDLYPDKDTTVNQQITVISPEPEKIDTMNIEFELNDNPYPQYA